MAVRTITFQIALIVIIVVAVLIIINSSWNLAQLNKTVGDACTCSGISDMDINNLRIYSVFMLLVGIGLLVYAVLMFLMPTAEKRMALRQGIAERYSHLDK
jgi:phage shock protein PspC (stress-responsive transcriptional regulator)